MPGAFTIFLISALLCVVMLLVLSSLLRSDIAGVRDWTRANVFGFAAFILYAFGQELPPLLAYEAANGMYAAAAAAVLLGYRRFFARPAHAPWLVGAVLLLVAAIVLFHYRIDSYALRTLAVSLFQGAIGAAIAYTVLGTRTERRSRYPYWFAGAMGITVAIGHAVRAGVHLAQSGEMTSLLQPSALGHLFIAAGAMALPVYTLGAVMLVHDRMLGQAEHAANRDFLTGAWSRRALFEVAEAEIDRSARARRDLALVVLDVDHFKSINDRLGHAAGDAVLVDVVHCAQRAIRTGDYLGRIGGEEFAILLPETGFDAAQRIAERLRASLQQHSANSAVPYTVSVGIARYRRGESLQTLMRRADAALYQAKAGGRNRVVDEAELPTA